MRHFEQLRLAEPIKKYEEQQGDDLWFPKKRVERGKKISEKDGGGIFATGLIRCRARQNKPIVNAKAQKKSGGDPEHGRPGGYKIAGAFLQFTRQNHQATLRGDFPDIEEYAAKPDEKRLLMFGRRQHVKTIRRDVMRCRTERHQPEKGEGELEKMRRGNRQGDRGEHRAQKKLHRPNPLPACF